MKIAIVSTGEAKAILDHTEGNFLGYSKDAVAFFVDNPLQKLETELPVANTCIGVQNLMLHEDLRKALLDDHVKVSKEFPVSSLFAFFNGENFSEWAEISFSQKFMSGNVGPEVGFTTGVGFRVAYDVLEAVPSIPKLKEVLRNLNYRGEVLCSVAENFTLTGVAFGHFYGHFAVFSEISRNSVQEILDFVFGKFPECKLYNSCCVANLVSQPPFPLIIPNSASPLHAPRSAEKHLWRIMINNLVETVLITTRGMSLSEARRRLRRTVENMLHYNSTLQYRNDYGFNLNFVLSAKKYEDAKTSNWKKPTNQPTNQPTNL